MPRRSPVMLTAAPMVAAAAFSLVACSSDSDRDPDNLVAYASYVDAYHRGDEELSFAVGLQAELRVRGSLGMDHDITKASCLDGSCRVEEVARLSPTTSRRSPTILVTPLAPTFNIHIDVVADAGPTTLDKEFQAVDATMGALHRGAGPGVPYIAGTAVTWYIGPRQKHIAWNAGLSTISVTPPFELVSKPKVGDGPDNETFVGVHVRATKPGTGTLTHMNREAVTTFPLVAVGRDEIKKLHVAAISESPQMVDAQALSSIAADQISVTASGYQTAWVVFETASGAFGVAGAGESLPSPRAGFDLHPYSDTFYSFGVWSTDDEEEKKAAQRPEEQPFLMIAAKGSVGTSKLLLRVGDVTGSADVNVVQGK